jgi:Rrf2 family protein
MISKQAKYALRALMALAALSPGESMLTAQIAERQRIPKKFLEQILLNLKRHGLVQSRRGSQGGYALLKPASEITFLQVLRIIDGPIAPLPCLSVTAYGRCSDCLDERTCEIRKAFARVAEATRDVLASATLADALASGSSSAGARSPKLRVKPRSAVA